MKLLLGKDAENVVKSYVPIAKSFVVKKYADVVKAAKNVGYPLVLKVVSKKIIHKTEVGGVKIVQNETELEKAYKDLTRIKKAEAFIVQEFVHGQELIAGIKHDPTFGPVIMLGTGGIFVEALKDITFRVCPITAEDVRSMIDDLKMKKILYGFRGKSVNIKKLSDVLVKLSRLPEKKKIQELDINPLIADEQGVKAVDVRILQ
jgi:4-hydroxybutyryl-CoA synthetase (ADP-forming)